MGPGDDAAVWLPPRGMAVVLSQDALVEDVDFRRAWGTPYGLGRRALAVAASDLAATGALLTGCLATVCASASTEEEDVLALQLGLAEAAAEAGGRLLGGDVSATAGPLVLDVCAVGAVEPDRALRRDAGRPGDILLLTGPVGGAAAGLRVLTGDLAAPVPDAVRAGWLAAQLDPRPRLREGRIAALSGVRCAGDLSDGLWVDAARTALASGCRAELWLDSVPVAPGLREAVGEGWVDTALGGGEDFELLLAVPEPVLGELRAAWPQDTPAPVAVGRLVEGEPGAVLLDRRGGSALPAPATASRHFA